MCVKGVWWGRVDDMGEDVRIEEMCVVEPPFFGLKNLEVTDEGGGD